MSELVNTLSDVLTPDTIGSLAGQLGMEEGQTASAVSAAMPLLISALSKNASDDSGAGSLLGALDSGHDGSILENVTDYISKGDFLDGAGIVGHILGKQQSVVQSGLGKAAGLDAGSAGKVIAALAPLVMGALGKQKQQQGLDVGGLTDFLSNEKKSAFSIDPDSVGVLGKLLDADQDGDLSDDLLNIGGKLLSGFLTK